MEMTKLRQTLVLLTTFLIDVIKIIKKEGRGRAGGREEEGGERQRKGGKGERKNMMQDTYPGTTSGCVNNY